MQNTIHQRQLGAGGFLGVDFSSAPYQTDPRRLSQCINLWHDWNGEMGGFLETFPGVRCLFQFDAPIFGLFLFQSKEEALPHLILHVGNRLYAAKAQEGAEEALPTLLFEGMAERESNAFMLDGQMGILDGTTYRLLSYQKAEDAFTVTSADDLYTPITYADNRAYEQRNALSSFFMELWHLPYTDGYGQGDMSNLQFEVISNLEKTCRLVGAKTKTSLVRIPSTAHIDGQAYRVTEIGDRAFQNDNIIQVLVIEEGIETIGRYAFNTCLSLSRVSLPSSLMHLKKACFAWCEVLKEVHLGEGLAYIDDHVFYQTPALSRISYGATEAEWAEAVKGNGNENLTNITPLFETATQIYARSYTLTVHEKCTEVISVKIGQEEISPEEYFLTKDTHFQADTTYYTAMGNRFVKAEVVEGEAIISDTYYQKRNVWYQPAKEQIEGEELITALYLYADDGRHLPQSQCVLEGRLSATQFAPTEESEFGSKANVSTKDAIHGATLCACFDGRVFLAGSPALPTTVFYANRTREGYVHPAYFGICNYMEDGRDNIGFSAMCATPTSLFLFKKENAEEGVVYCHSPKDTDSHLLPRIYPAVAGIVGSGGVGPACHFADDTVFLSKKGLEATEKSSLSSERGLSHRSYLVDNVLCQEDLAHTKMVEWKGYLLLLCPSGKVYMADSRLLCRHKTGDVGYEWVCLEGIGGYTEDIPVYRFATVFPYYAQKCFLGNEEILLSPEGDTLPFGSYEDYQREYPTAVHSAELTYLLPSGESVTEMGHYGVFPSETGPLYYLLYLTEERTGGIFSPAVVAETINDLLYLGTKDGHLLICNTDMRGRPYKTGAPPAPHTIDRRHYHICHHRIPSLAVTISDNADCPTMTKTTLKKSTIIDTKALPGSRITVMVGTDRADFSPVGVYTDGQLDFGDVDLFSFVFGDRNRGQAVFSENTKRWSYKQYAMFSDDYQRPFGIGQLSYRYRVEGRMKPQ